MDQAGTPTLPTIEEEGGDAVQRWQTTNVRSELVSLRGSAKANHTKVTTKITNALNSSIASASQLKKLRSELVDAYEEVEKRHQRLVNEMTEEADRPAEDSWLQAVITSHRKTLELLAETNIDDAAPSVSLSRRSGSSGHSRSSALSKLRDAEVDEQAALLKLQQTEEELKLQAQEDQVINNIKASQQLRKAQNELAEKVLRRSSLAASVAQDFHDHNSPGQDWTAPATTPSSSPVNIINPNPSAPSPSSSSSPSVIITTNSPVPSGSRSSPGMVITPKVSGPSETSSLPAFGVPSTSSSVTTGAVHPSTPLRRLRSWSSRVLNAFTPQNKQQQHYSASAFVSSSTTPTTSPPGAQLGGTTTTASVTTPLLSSQIQVTGIPLTGRGVLGAPPSQSAPSGRGVFGAPLTGAPPSASFSNVMTTSSSTGSATLGRGASGAPPTFSSGSSGRGALGAPPATGPYSAPSASTGAPPTCASASYGQGTISTPLPHTSNFAPFTGTATFAGASASFGRGVYGAPPASIPGLFSSASGHSMQYHQSAGPYGNQTGQLAQPPPPAPFPPSNALAPISATTSASAFGPPGYLNQGAIYSPDAWIYDMASWRAAGGGVHRGLTRLPKMKLPVFDGDPMKWPSFIQTFGSQVDRVCSDDSERLSLLQDCLNPEITMQLGHLLLHPGLYQQCMMELHRRYGSPRIVAAACSRALLELEAFRDDDFNGVKKFSGQLRAAVSTLQLGGYGAELQSNATLTNVVKKIPPILKSQWAQASYGIIDHLPDLADLDAWLDQYVMAETCVRAGNDSFAPSDPPKDRQEQKGGKGTKLKTFANTTDDNSASRSSDDTIFCANCNRKGHTVNECRKFRELDMEMRVEVVRSKGLCLRCLGSGHIVARCSSTKTCGTGGCKGHHHSLLHNAPRIHPKPPTGSSAPTSSTGTAPTVVTTSAPAVPVTSHHASVKEPPAERLVLLPIVDVIVSAGSRSFHTLALLDPGSQVTMISEWAKRKLGLTGPAEDVRIGTWHAHDPAVKSARVNFKVAAVDDSSSFNIAGAYAVPSLNLSKRSVDPVWLRKKWPHLVGIPLTNAGASEVTILIGADHIDALEIMEYRKDSLRPNSPHAILTPFGWTITGNVLKPRSDRPGCHVAVVGSDQDLAGDLNKFLLLDSYEAQQGASTPVSQEIIRCRKILENTLKFLPEEGRYEAGVLWKSDDVHLPDNRHGVQQRFARTMKRVEANPTLSTVVSEEMEKMFSAEFAVKLSASDIAALPPGRTWYLPWHPVQHPHKPKWRIVFDAAAEFHGVSLNSQLLKGDVDLVNLVGVLLRFREGRVALCADVKKMFHQVRVRKKDDSIYLFLYRPPGSSDPPATYRMTRHIFGAVCSPFICAQALRRAAMDADPEDVDQLLHQIDFHFYVDNLVTSFPSREAAIKMLFILVKGLGKGGFELAEFGSSDAEVLAACRSLVSSVSLLDMSLDGSLTERMLGLLLDFVADNFIMKATADVNCRTSRDLLRATATNYDPLGFLAAVLLPAKLILQRVVHLTKCWDDPLPPDLAKAWADWAGSLPAVADLRIPRCYCAEDYDPDATDLMMFSDASERAFGSIGYFRFTLRDGSYRVAFVVAKNRVAPLKYVSMPRLELCGCLSSVRLALMIQKETLIPIRKIFYFTDSNTCLRWLNSKECKFTIYVGNRVGEILDSSVPSQWFYVNTRDNPADDLTRGLPVVELTINHRYFTGPAMLLQPDESWPTFPEIGPAKDAQLDPEIRALHWTGAIVQEPLHLDTMMATRLPIPFSRVKRTVAFILRWVDGFRRRKITQLAEGTPVESSTGASPPKVAITRYLPAGKVIEVEDLTSEEIQQAVDLLIRRAQSAAYPDELLDLQCGRAVNPTSPIAPAFPFINARGLLCVGGRIENAPVPYDVRHPVILPPKDIVTTRIIREIHLEAGHSSAFRTLPEVQRCYWMTSARRIVKKIVNHCWLCRRNVAKPLASLMAPLPTSRLRPFQPPFTATGVDFFGPIEVIQLRRRVKRWGCLFTCLTTRAVHLEMAYSMETDAFLTALDNFKAVRGCPLFIHADNGTNFKGARRELAEALERLDQTRIHSHLALKGIEWRFNPPASPHFGGSWEKLVQSAKRALEGVLHLRPLTDQSLSAGLKQVEHLLNSRPLTHVGVDPTAPEPLTPFHILLGRANPNIPPDVFNEDDLDHRKRWRVAQSFADHFWRRWMKEYLPGLTERRKWLSKERNLQVEDIVLVIDPNTPRGQWPLGRIINVYPGPDGVVRSADVRHNGTILQRPAVKLCLLEPAEPTSAPADQPDPADPPADVLPDTA